MKLNDEQAVTVERLLTLEEIQALQQENEQLKAQNAVMREALKNLVDSIDDANDDFEYDLIEYSKTSFEMLEAKDVLSNNVTYSCA